MRQIVLIVALSLSMLPAFSQVSVGITGGGTLSRYHYPHNSLSKYRTNTFITAWHAGLIAETKLAGNFYLQPQLLVSRQGGISEIDMTTDQARNYVKGVNHTTYLQLPLNLIYKYKRWYAGAGPYIARGLGGRFHNRSVYIYGDGVGNISVTETNGKVEFSSSEDKVKPYNLYMRAMDYGANFIGGYEFKSGLFLNANYSLGLTGVYGKETGVKNRYWGLSAGWFFKK
ncbi:outer membrane beta-barrel protein [Chitinophaga sancti]|uniref:outer membrane beta-barrel protein n=1 Tax=Chitinophaga sancti TaxID=1004 RepID=UPI003F79F2B2